MTITYNTHQKKIVLLGLAESGKSTIIKNVIEGHKTEPGEKYDATINYQRKLKDICGKEIIIFDLGGQTRFLDKFTGDLSQFVFSDVNTFIFVIDPLQTAYFSRSKFYLELSLEKLKLFSPKATIFLFFHKMDLIPGPKRESIVQNLKNYLLSEIDNPIRYCETSVFSSTIYVALGNIISDILEINIRFHETLIKFLDEHKNIIDEIHILTHEGAILLQLANTNFKSKVPAKTLNKYFNLSLKQKTDFNIENTIISIEDTKRVYLSYFFANGLVILFVITKESKSQDLGFTSNIWDHILNLVFSLNKISDHGKEMNL